MKRKHHFEKFCVNRMIIEFKEICVDGVDCMWLRIVRVNGVDWIDVTPDNIQWTRGFMTTMLAGLRR